MSFSGAPHSQTSKLFIAISSLILPCSWYRHGIAYYRSINVLGVSKVANTVAFHHGNTRVFGGSGKPTFPS
jgi:hypothetical protein